MRGILRPCRHRLGDELGARWESHLCGGCLTLRDLAGQSSRVVTGYDTLLVSVLVEAQQGRLETRPAGPCPLRGFRRADVVASSEPAARAVAAVGLLGASAALTDKALDGDLPALARPAVARLGRRLSVEGTVVAAAVGFDPRSILAAPAQSARVESETDELDELLAPAGRAVAAVFAHTAVLAGLESNAGPLARAGDAFGRLEHLVDAVTDRDLDRRRGRFNPLTASGTTPAGARQLAEALLAEFRTALDEAVFVDPALLDALVDELDRSVHRLVRSGPSRSAAALAPAVVLAAAGRSPREGRPGRRARPERAGSGCCRGTCCECCGEGCCDGVCNACSC